VFAFSETAIDRLEFALFSDGEVFRAHEELIVKSASKTVAKALGFNSSP
jgi:hypothetical protein